MPEFASAAPAGSEPWRPNLMPLIALTVVTCAITGLLLFNTYITRQAAPQFTADGRSYVLRLSAPLDMPPEIKAHGTRLIQAITAAREQASQLRADVAERANRDQEYRVEIAGFLEQLHNAEQMIADLKQEIGDLQQANEAGAVTDSLQAQRGNGH